MTEYLSIFISTLFTLSLIALYLFGWVMFDKWITWWHEKNDSGFIYCARMFVTVVFFIVWIAIPISLFIYFIEQNGVSL